jgi:hypothetical protein
MVARKVNNPFTFWSFNCIGQTHGMISPKGTMHIQLDGSMKQSKTQWTDYFNIEHEEISNYLHHGRIWQVEQVTYSLGFDFGLPHKLEIQIHHHQMS